MVITYNSRRIVPTYAYLRAVSWFAFEQAKKTELGRFNNLITAMVFSAFCLEAFLNHVGDEKVPNWRNFKRDPYKKLADVCRSVNLVIDENSRPFSSFKEIFEFRNNLAHAQTEVLDDTVYRLTCAETDDLEPLTKWETKIDLSIAEIYLGDTKEIVKQIAKAVGYNPENILDFVKSKRLIRHLGIDSISSS